MPQLTGGGSLNREGGSRPKFSGSVLIGGGYLFFLPRVFFTGSMPSGIFYPPGYFLSPFNRMGGGRTPKTGEAC